MRRAVTEDHGENNSMVQNARRNSVPDPHPKRAGALPVSVSSDCVWSHVLEHNAPASRHPEGEKNIQATVIPGEDRCVSKLQVPGCQTRSLRLSSVGDGRCSGPGPSEDRRERISQHWLILHHERARSNYRQLRAVALESEARN